MGLAVGACDQRVLVGTTALCPIIGSSDGCGIEEICIDLETDDCDPLVAAGCQGRCNVISTEFDLAGTDQLFDSSPGDAVKDSDF